MAHEKDRQTKPTETWAEVFTALDASKVNDGFVVERDVSAAEERPAMDAFFAAEVGPKQKSE